MADCAAGVAKGTYVVVKKMDLKYPGRHTEALMMEQVAHPHVVRLLGVCPSDETANGDADVWLVMEHARCDASNAVSDEAGDACSAAQILSLLLHVCEALVHIHTRMRCAHMDLKPGNILLFGKGDGCVAKDFGLFEIAQGNRRSKHRGLHESICPSGTVARRTSQSRGGLRATSTPLEASCSKRTLNDTPRPSS